MHRNYLPVLGSVLIFLLLLPGRGSAQPSDLRVRESNPNYDQGDWRSYSVARDITSIAIGTQYVYFGTLRSGVLRLDQFQLVWDYPWTSSNGLTDNTVWVVAFDADTGLLWCATQQAVSYYSPTSKRWVNAYKDEIGIPSQDRVESIGIARNRVLIKTRNQRLFEANKFGGVILVARNNSGSPLGDPTVRWFGQQAKRRRTFPHFFMSNGYLFDPSGVVEGPNFRRAEVVVSLEDDWGNFWIGTAGLGAGRGDVQSLQLTMLSFGLANRSVRALSFWNDVLWMGGLGRSNENRGITAWDLNRDEWMTYEQRDISGLYSNEINGIAVDGDDIFFATTFGLTQYSVSKERWRTFDRFDGLSDNLVFDVTADDSSLWVASASGLDRIWKASFSQKDSLKVEHVIAGGLNLIEVYDLELMENLVWAGTNSGIYVYDKNKNQGGFADEIGGPTGRVIRSISRSGDELWFGSSRGVDVYDVKKKEWLGVPAGRAFPNTVINRIVATKDVVWAASNSGVLKYDRKRAAWRKFTTEDGLISNHVYAILVDGDFVWFGTDRGVTQFYWNSNFRID